MDDSSFDLFFTFAWDGSNSPGNQYYVPMNIIYDHNMIIRYRSYGFKENAIKNKIEELIDAMPAVSINESSPRVYHPSNFQISEFYPNPFNSQTNLNLRMSQPAIISITIYNSMGKEVLKLVKAKKFEIGKHIISWEPDEKISSGVYIVLIQFPLGRDVRKVIMIK
tara:strand:- start:12355 stop:12852 length:498 start_codon:yes stop_codon:yes gene_type:complete